MLERLTNGRKSSRRQSAFLYVLFRIDLIVFSCDLSLSIAIAIGENFLSVPLFRESFFTASLARTWACFTCLLRSVRFGRGVLGQSLYKEWSQERRHA
jgi:hypothetical protein